MALASWRANELDFPTTVGRPEFRAVARFGRTSVRIRVFGLSLPHSALVQAVAGRRVYWVVKRTGFKPGPRKPLRKHRKGSCKHLVWDAFSIRIRQRDSDENGMIKCISCDRVDHWRKMQAGHFIPASVSLALRFDERNVNGQCGPCNLYDKRSIHRYALSMIKKYGPTILEDLDVKRREGQGFKISEPTYREMLERYKALVK